MYTLLIVDDEEIEREGMAQFIPWDSYEIKVVSTARNGAEGLEKIAKFRPDLAIVDIKMPVMNGIEMIRQAKEQYPDMTFVVLSGYGDYEFTSQAMELGVRHYILKPCDESKMIPVLNKAFAELEEARDKVSWGRERRSLAINERGRRITAVHEAGHAICLLKTPPSEPLHRVTIVPRGGALGMTMWLPSDDKMHQLRSEMLDQLVVAMGGRCAEQIVFGDVTSGATGDIKSATNLARRMVCEFGMSEKLGLIEYGEHQGEVYIARDLGTRSRNYSESTAELIDSEVRFLVDSAYERAMAILTENRDKLDILTEALMEFETLEGSQVMDILEYGEMKNPPSRVTPPPMPSEVEEQPGKDDSGHNEKKEAEETRADGAEERKMEEELEQAERDPFSYNPVDEFGKDGGEKK